MKSLFCQPQPDVVSNSLAAPTSSNSSLQEPVLHPGAVASKLCTKWSVQHTFKWWFSCAINIKVKKKDFMLWDYLVQGWVFLNANQTKSICFYRHMLAFPDCLRSITKTSTIWSGSTCVYIREGVNKKKTIESVIMIIPCRTPPPLFWELWSP